MLHIYMHYNVPEQKRRSQRYIPLQLEYYEELLKSQMTTVFMQNGIAAWEYGKVQIPYWETMKLKSISYVCPCERAGVVPVRRHRAAACFVAGGVVFLGGAFQVR